MMKGLVFFENTEVPVRPGIISSNRPVVIVSDRAVGGCVQVVPLTTSEAKLNDESGFHIPIESTGRSSVALCEQIRTVPLTELGRMPKAVCSESEIDAIDAAVCALFGFDVMEDE